MKKLVPKKVNAWYFISYVDEYEVTRYFGYDYQKGRFHWFASAKSACWFVADPIIDQEASTIKVSGAMYPIKYDSNLIKRIFHHKTTVELIE